MSVDEKYEHDRDENRRLEEDIRQQTSDVPIPERLKPENIEVMLKNHKKVKKWPYGFAAACCVLILGVTSWQRGNFFTESSSSSKKSSLSSQSKTVEKAHAEAGKGKIIAATDYEQVFSYVEAEQDRIKRMNRGGETIGLFDSHQSAEKSTASNSTGTAAYGAGIQAGQTETSAYSDTNVRDTGVDEGDIVKIDGKNIYMLYGSNVRIVNIEDDVMKEMAAIQVDTEDSVREIYVKDDRLLIVYSHTEFTDGTARYGGEYQSYTIGETYDITNPEEPKSLGKITQSGDFNTLRVKEETIYLLSNYSINLDSARSAQRDTYIPTVQGEFLKSDSILLPQQTAGSQYTVITSFSLKEPGEKMDSKAVLGTPGLVYVSEQNIYICESHYETSKSRTTETSIRKVSYANGKLQGVGQTRIAGILNDSFSIDEYEGNLRLVATVSAVSPASDDSAVAFTGQSREGGREDSSTNLYILNQELHELGSIKGLAADEWVYSARFMGKTGYFVTFKSVDPLFSVDLSNPKKPEILGMLKIPGFSEYLHPYGENQLLGIGMEVDEAGITTQGMKLSMFDTSDQGNVKEVQKYVLEDAYSTELFYNYKAVFMSEEKNLFGFAASGSDNHYYLFSYDSEDGFNTVFDRVVSNGQSVRGIYAGNRFYLVNGSTIESFDMKNFQKIDDIVL